MKYGFWTLLVSALTFTIFMLVDMPFWLLMAIVIPLLIIGFIYGSFLYSFRESLKIENIPDSGYKSRTDNLDRESNRIKALGFLKIDQFYLKTIPDSVTYIYKHEKEPIYFCVYHFGKKSACDFVTRYEHGFFLTTTNSIDSGMSPRPAKALLEIFPGQTYEKLLSEHRRSHDYIVQQGIRVYNIRETEFRFYFMKSLREQASYIRTFPFWPVMLLLRTVTQYGKKFCSSVVNQYPAGFSRIISKPPDSYPS